MGMITPGRQFGQRLWCGWVKKIGSCFTPRSCVVDCQLGGPIASRFVQDQRHYRRW